MAISRAQLAKELEPGLNALFGMEYDRYENQHAEIYTTESSDRAFEEEVMLSGFGSYEVKYKPPRRGRNPQTGESIILRARRVVKFKPSQLLRKAINGQAIDESFDI
jgi:nucleoid DNA-binding protein